MVGGTAVTADHLEALLLTCSQDTITAWQLILHSEITEFWLKVINWISRITIKANNHAVLMVTGSNPPSFISDPHIVEWITHRAKLLVGQAEAKALLTACAKATTLHDQQLAILVYNLNDTNNDRQLAMLVSATS